MRIIAGQYRGRQVRALRGQELRPTSDRLRETLFNVLSAGRAEALAGREVNEESAAHVGELAARTAKPLTTSALTPEYRREMIRIFTKRAVLEAAAIDRRP